MKYQHCLAVSPVRYSVVVCLCYLIPLRAARFLIPAVCELVLRLLRIHKLTPRDSESESLRGPAWATRDGRNRANAVRQPRDLQAHCAHLHFQFYFHTRSGGARGRTAAQSAEAALVEDARLLYLLPCQCDISVFFSFTFPSRTTNRHRKVRVVWSS